MKKKNLVTIFIFLATFIAVASFVYGANPYEEKFLGKWSGEDDPDIFVFEDKNICYFIDEDGNKITENGRWSADSKKLSFELKYNGKRYRTIFEYSFLDNDSVQLKVVKNLIDGKEEKFEVSEFTMHRIKD
jgi:hypothetical protein